MELAECDPELLCVPIEWRKLQEVLYTDFRLKIFQIESSKRELMLTRLKPFWYGVELDLLEESFIIRHLLKWSLARTAKPNNDD